MYYLSDENKRADQLHVTAQLICAFVFTYAKIRFLMMRLFFCLLVQLRAGCLPIEIELGRYQQVPRNKRLCKQCTLGTIENEKHFLFHCSRYHDPRQDYIREINSVCPQNSNDDQILVSIFSSKTLLFKTAHFIYEALKLRIS